MKTLNKTETFETFETDTTRFLEAEKINFEHTESGFLNLSYKEESYNQISLIRLLPFREKNRYISVSYLDDDKEWHEVGIIKDMEELPEAQKSLALEYIDYRYYIPIITQIFDITDNRMGYLFIDAETTAGRKRIAVNDWWSNFRLTPTNLLNVVDADGNRYMIPKVENMDSKSRKKLELFI